MSTGGSMTMVEKVGEGFGMLRSGGIQAVAERVKNSFNQPAQTAVPEADCPKVVTPNEKARVSKSQNKQFLRVLAELLKVTAVNRTSNTHLLGLVRT